MKQFSEEEGCPKCGSHNLYLRFQRFVSCGDDCLAIVCQRCGYKYERAPLDAEPEAADADPEQDAG